MKNFIKNFSRFQRLNEERGSMDSDYQDEERESMDSDYQVMDETQVPIVRLTIQGPHDDITVFKNLDNGKWLSGDYDETTERALDEDFEEMARVAGLDPNKEVFFFQYLFDVDEYFTTASAEQVIARYRDMGIGMQR